jgi:CheY-like chemotaxis protein
MVDQNILSRKKMLWIDADVLYLEPYIEFFERNGFDVILCGSLTKAREFLTQQKFDIIILDIMIAPTSEEEKSTYDFASTNGGRQAGLVFYIQMKSRLEDQRTPVLVLTQRLDLEIQNRFLAEGVPAKSFARKVDFPEVTRLLEKVLELLDEKSREEQA